MSLHLEVNSNPVLQLLGRYNQTYRDYCPGFFYLFAIPFETPVFFKLFCTQSEGYGSTFLLVDAPEVLEWIQGIGRKYKSVQYTVSDITIGTETFKQGLYIHHEFSQYFIISEGKPLPLQITDVQRFVRIRYDTAHPNMELYRKACDEHYGPSSVKPLLGSNKFGEVKFHYIPDHLEETIEAIYLMKSKK